MTLEKSLLVELPHDFDGILAELGAQLVERARRRAYSTVAFIGGDASRHRLDVVFEHSLQVLAVAFNLYLHELYEAVLVGRRYVKTGDLSRPVAEAVDGERHLLGGEVG